MRNLRSALRVPQTSRQHETPYAHASMWTFEAGRRYCSATSEVLHYRGARAMSRKGWRDSCRIRIRLRFGSQVRLKAALTCDVER
jgi:hypothetical protein